MGGSSKQTIGYRYYLGMHLVLCHAPVDRILQIEIDEREAWAGDSTGGRISINAPDLFGGDESGGGVAGLVDLEFGEDDQPVNDYLESQLGDIVPAFRGVVGAVLRKCYVSNSTYLRPWAFLIKRTQTRVGGQEQWYRSRAEIDGDMNPAHIIRECLTDPVWGMGYPESEIDDLSFTATAHTLYEEGFGLSLLWDRSAGIDDFIAEVLRHIDGTLYVDQETGLFCLKLAREDYNIETLPVFDESNISRITDFKRDAIGDLVNSVTVTFCDRGTHKDNSVTVSDIALISRQAGATISEKLDYQGITKGALALRVAVRDLQALSAPLTSATIYTSRHGATLKPCDCFVLHWPRYGVESMVMRVVNIEYGTLKDNTVRITCVEDVFAIGDTVFAAPAESEWEDPISEPAASPHQRIIEVPYFGIVRAVGEHEAREVSDDSGFVGFLCTRPSPDAINARMHLREFNDWEDVGAVDFCGSCVTTSAVAKGDTTIYVEDWVDRHRITIGGLALIGDEFVRVDGVEDLYITVGRGCLDTVPATHSPGARIYFISDSIAFSSVEFVRGERAEARVTPVTGKGTYPISNAQTVKVDIEGRQARPYPPGRFRVNGIANPSFVFVPLGEDMAVTWVHRNRLQQTGRTIIDTEAGSMTPEANLEYRVQVRLASGGTIATYDEIAGMECMVERELLEPYDGQQIRVDITAVRDGFWSLQSHDITFTLNMET